MKRMVLIPEEKLLQYEQQKSDDNPKDLPNTQQGWGEKREERELSDDVIVRGIPKTMRTRAIALLERLRARSDVISWDDMGQVKIDGVLIPKSNISDLVSSAMRPRKHFDPIASQKFFGVLNNINVPKDLVRNEEGWRKVTQKGKGKDRDDFLETMRGFKHLTSANLKPFFGGGKGRGKRKKPTTQGGGFAFGPYTHGLNGIEKKRRAPQKGSGKLHKIPNWECYKG